MRKRQLTDLCDERLVDRGNRILDDLFRKGSHSIRQLTASDSDAKGFYRFLQNDRVTEADIIKNLSANCRQAASGKHVVCIQDSTEINLSAHSGRIKKDGCIGTTNANNKMGLGFFLHPCLVLDATECIPYGYAAVKVWNRPLEFASKHTRQYNKLPIEDKESYKWIEVSEQSKNALADTVSSMVIVQDREGDIYEQFALLPDHKTDLLVRARVNRTLPDKTKLFDCLGDQPCQGTYQVSVEGKKGRQGRVATIEVRFREVTISRTDASSRSVPRTISLSLIEARERDYEGEDGICWRLLTTIEVTDIDLARMCIEWYSWRWTIEEVFKILKKEGFDMEASELEYASSVRKMC
ncbi:IS4 family transposase, partial [archaeon]